MVSYHTPENAIGAAENFSLRRWRRWSPLVCLSSPPSIFSHSQDARSCLHESSRHAASDAKTRDAVVAKVPESMLTTTLNKTASLNLTTWSRDYSSVTQKLTNLLLMQASLFHSEFPMHRMIEDIRVLFRFKISRKMMPSDFARARVESERSKMGHNIVYRGSTKVRRLSTWKPNASNDTTFVSDANRFR